METNMQINVVDLINMQINVVDLINMQIISI